jgi:hypothetical protein
MSPRYELPGSFMRKLRADKSATDELSKVDVADRHGILMDRIANPIISVWCV